MPPDMQARDLEIPMTNAAGEHGEHHEEHGGGKESGPFKDILDTPWANNVEFPIDVVAVCALGCAMGLLAVPYILAVEKIPVWWIKKTSGKEFPEDFDSLQFAAGSPTWILVCWLGSTAVGVVKVLLRLDAYPSFITELKHQAADPWQAAKVVVCCILSLCAGATLGPEAGLGSAGAAVGHIVSGFCTRFGVQDAHSLDLRRRAFVVAGMAAAFGSILPAPYIAVVLCCELSSAGTEQYDETSERNRASEGGRRLPLKIMTQLVPAATFSFAVKYAMDKVVDPKDDPKAPGVAIPYDQWSPVIAIGLGIIGVAGALVFLIVTAVVKGVMTKIGTAIEARCGQAVRIIALCSISGLAVGVIIYLFPLAIGSGRDTLLPSIKFAGLIPGPDKLSTELYVGTGLAKTVAFAFANSGGLVGGIFFPMLFIAEILGIVCSRLLNVPFGVAVPVMFACLPAAIISAPLSMLLLPVGMFMMGPLQTVPILMGIMTANTLLVGTGVLHRLLSGGQRESS
eukprot:TRINITY_DN38293_c0_g1_i1.p1 TRINITY_DN38293_c0_g1~~TRINITY_DN38293_c0_g1_i1.p1  ORF type:complete len:511 (+),score=104.98 TRINITY_DN38293_c0_g1_i1:82-1614(+)